MPIIVVPYDDADVVYDSPLFTYDGGAAESTETIGFLGFDSITLRPGLSPGNEAVLAGTALRDIDDDLVAGAVVTASLLRAGESIWSSVGLTDIDGDFSASVPDDLELTVGEILTERIEVESGTVNATYETERRVRRRRG